MKELAEGFHVPPVETREFAGGLETRQTAKIGSSFDGTLDPQG
jgi:hypothetical protein